MFADPQAGPIVQVAGPGEFARLLKHRVMTLVVFTAACGLAVAPGTMPAATALAALLAVAMGSGGAAALNMWFDHDIDARMPRTAGRPVPRGLIARDDALGIGLLLSCLALTLMMLASNALATALLAASIAFYVLVYTMWLKRRTDQNIVIGGAAGALPPVIGWAAATGEAPLAAWSLFAIIFFWTPPHFWALSLWTRADYRQAGVPMLSVTRGARSARAHVLAYVLLLVPLSAAPFALGAGGPFYLASAAMLGLALIVLAVRLWRSRAGEDGAEADIVHARRLFLASNLYLLALFAALPIDRWLVHGLAGP